MFGMHSSSRRRRSVRDRSLAEKVPPPHASVKSRTVEPGVLKANQSAEGDFTFVPAFDNSTRSRARFYGDDIPFKARVDQKDLNYLISRDELAAHAWRKEKAVLFNRGHSFEAWKTVNGEREDNPELEDQLKSFFQKLDADREIRQAWSLKYQYGFCPISITRAESLENYDQLAEPADTTKDIIKISGISGDQVDGDIKLGTDIRSPDYGEPVMYPIILPSGSYEKTFPIHASRFLLWKEEWLDNHPKGIPRNHALYDAWCIKKHNDNALSEVLRQFARPLPVARPLATDPKMFPKKEEFKAMKADMVDFDNTSNVVLPPNWVLELLSTDGALDPKPHTDYNIQNLAAGSLGTELALTGKPAGTQSTAGENTAQFFADMADEQKNDIAPVYYALGELGVESGQIKMGEGDGWRMRFNALWEMDVKEEAEVALLDARTAWYQAQTLSIMTHPTTGLGWSPMPDGDDITAVSPDGAEFSVSVAGIPVARPVPPDGILSATQMAGIMRAYNGTVRGLTQPERRSLYTKWEPKTATGEARMTDAAQTHLTMMLNQFLEEFDTQWEKELGQGYSPTGAGNTGYNVAGQAEFQTTLEGWLPPGMTSFEDDMGEHLVDAWSVSVGETQAALGQAVNPELVIDANTINQIKANGQKLAKDLFGSQHKAVMNQIVEGLQSGKGRAEIQEMISKNVFAGVKKLPATIQKYIHTEASLARFQTMRKYGATEFTYLTANDDNVRPHHAQMEGHRGTEEDFMGLLSEFGCRCTIIPVTAWDEVVAKKALEAT